MLLEGQSGIRQLDKPFVGEFKSPVRIGGQLQESFDEHLSRVELRRLSFMQKMSLLLGRRLWESAGSPEIDTRRLMVSIGLALGGTEEIRPRSTTPGRRRACARCPRSPCRCTCPMRPPRRSGWIVRRRRGSSRR